MALSSLVLAPGFHGAKTQCDWSAPVVDVDVAVDVLFDDGRELFVVVEPDLALRNVDQASWEPSHPLIVRLSGLAVGARFTDADGRGGTVHALRHKYVARFHYVLKHYETRFPNHQGFRSISIAPNEPGGLEEFIDQLKRRRDWFDQEVQEYERGPWPLSVLAERLGIDAIEAAGGLVAQGKKLKVALGNEPERNAATLDVRRNARKGCVIDLQTFWTAWRLRVLDVVSSTCGPIHVCRSVIDQLRARLERLAGPGQDNHRSASYEDGKIAIHEISAQVLEEWRDDLSRAIAWLGTNASITPTVAIDSLPDAFREHLRAGRGDMLDGLAAASQLGLMLLSDDLPTRQLAGMVGNVGSCWLHHVLGLAHASRRTTLGQHVRWSAHLAEAGKNYLGVSGAALFHALQLDVQAGTSPGRLYGSLVRMIGGAAAEPVSHVGTALECLRRLWSPAGAGIDREAATSILLRRLLSYRSNDYGAILKTLILAVKNSPYLLAFCLTWTRGNFIPDDAIWGTRPD